MNKKELMENLAILEMRPGKILGQNFLLDGNLLDFIVRSAALTPGEIVLEAGPGFGALTRPLIASGAEVYSIEFDRRVCEFIRERITDSNFHLIEGDACRVRFEDFLPPGKPFRAIANLPYSISSIFVAKLLELENPPIQMIFMLQKEMGMRLASPVNTKNYGALTVRTQLLYDVKILRTVPPQVFFPQPGVDSALVEFKLKANLPEPALRKKVSGLSRTAFAQRRKMIFKPLAASYGTEEVTAALEELNISPEVRAGELSVGTYLELAKRL